MLLLVATAIILMSGTGIVLLMIMYISRSIAPRYGNETNINRVWVKINLFIVFATTLIIMNNIDVGSYQKFSLEYYPSTFFYIKSSADRKFYF